MYETFGYIGGGLLALQLVPQIYKTFTQKNADNLSLQFMCCNVVGLCFMGVYGFSNRDWPLVLPICVSCVNTIILIVLKMRFK